MYRNLCTYWSNAFINRQKCTTISRLGALATKNLLNFLLINFQFQNQIILTTLPNYKNNRQILQVNLYQKLLFLHQLTHNMTTVCSLNYKFNTWKFQAQNMGRTCCVQKLFWMSETISVHNMFSPGLSLEFSCIELVIQWTICRHCVG